MMDTICRVPLRGHPSFLLARQSFDDAFQPACLRSVDAWLGGNETQRLVQTREHGSLAARMLAEPFGKIGRDAGVEPAIFAFQ